MKKPRGIAIAGNWKMFHSPKNTRIFFESLKNSSPVSAFELLKNNPSLKSTLFVPALSMTTALEMAKGTPLKIGAQNVHWEVQGAFTGEISGPMLNEIGIRSALVGHSERRQYFGETDETARLRTESLLAQGFEVILCIGETQKERESGQTEEILNRQLTGALKTSPTRSLQLAYEPVWAIGTGLTATPEQAENAHQYIRKWLWERFGMDAASHTPILYGGSVKTDNLESLLSCPNIDGALVGGASLDPNSYTKLLDIGTKALV